MSYEAQKFEELIGVEGLSDDLLENHFSLYEGYVKNTNVLLEILDTKTPGDIEYSELQRRFGWEFNGMRLHELYFENLTKNAVNLTSKCSLSQKIDKIYGDYDNWKRNFVAVASMRGIGWAVLYYDKKSDELFNIWVNEHDSGHLAGCIPIIVCDCFEHAYILDYGIKRADYIDAFFKNLNWSVVEDRFKAAL